MMVEGVLRTNGNVGGGDGWFAKNVMCIGRLIRYYSAISALIIFGFSYCRMIQEGSGELDTECAVGEWEASYLCLSGKTRRGILILLCSTCPAKKI